MYTTITLHRIQGLLARTIKRVANTTTFSVSALELLAYTHSWINGVRTSCNNANDTTEVQAAQVDGYSQWWANHKSNRKSHFNLKMKFKGKCATGIKQFQSSHANTQHIQLAYLLLQVRWFRSCLSTAFYINFMMCLLLVKCNLALGKALVVLMQFSYFVKWSITLRPMVTLCGSFRCA